jgi:hypothetical protein
MGYKRTYIGHSIPPSTNQPRSGDFASQICPERGGERGGERERGRGRKGERERAREGGKERERWRGRGREGGREGERERGREHMGVWVGGGGRHVEIMLESFRYGSD